MIKFCRIYLIIYIRYFIHRTFDKKQEISDNKKQEISFLNKNDELETIYFASDEMLESIQLEDSTV